MMTKGQLIYANTTSNYIIMCVYSYMYALIIHKLFLTRYFDIADDCCHYRRLVDAYTVVERNKRR
jgi:hypothetical protein